MQVALLASAAGLWMAVRTAPALAGVGALLATMVQMGVLGAIITFSSSALYAPHLLGPQDWGYSPLADQQLEIGRATRRERMGNYGCISVVAVSLKKKITRE